MSASNTLPRSSSMPKCEKQQAVQTAMAVGMFGVGATVLALRKGTQQHRVLGRIWMGTMMVTCLSALGARNVKAELASVGQVTSTLTIASALSGIYSARQKVPKLHANFMRAACAGAAITGMIVLWPSLPRDQKPFQR